MYELTSALCKTFHFDQLTAEEGLHTLSLAHRLGVRPVAPDDELVCSAYAWTLHLNRAAAFDSFYLALAEDLGCDLWTADQHLVRAVDRPWVRLAVTPS